jgi:hypothetical protein
MNFDDLLNLTASFYDDYTKLAKIGKIYPKSSLSFTNTESHNYSTTLKSKKIGSTLFGSALTQ